jgi:hypothetical protein
MDKHTRIVHQKERPFKCNFCGTAFGQKVHMDSHISAVHNQVGENIKRFFCKGLFTRSDRLPCRRQHDAMLRDIAQKLELILSVNCPSLCVVRHWATQSNMKIIVCVNRR